MRHLGSPSGPQAVERLPDPPVPGAPSGQWWPPQMLRPDWVLRHAREFDVMHLHFGFDDCSVAELTAWIAALARVRRPLVLTVHDLQNPHHLDSDRHDAALGVLIPAAAEVITLTGGAAAQIRDRWGRHATVIPHPHLVPLDRARPERPLAHTDFIVGLHAKSVRANSDPVGVARALAGALEPLDHASLRVDAHDDDAGRAVAAALPHLDVRLHPRFDDDELWAYLSGLDASVLPYRFGTHSGWLEACHDLGTTVIAPDIGFYSEQGPCLLYDLGPDGPDAGSLERAVRFAYEQRPLWRADPEDRRRQRVRICAAHDEVYRSTMRAVAS